MKKNCAWYVEASGDSDIDGCSMLVIAKAIKHFDKWGIVKWDGGKL